MRISRYLIGQVGISINEFEGAARWQQQPKLDPQA